MDSIDKLIDALKADLSDRNGLDWGDLDAGVQDEIRADWRKIIERRLLPAGEVLTRGVITQWKSERLHGNGPAVATGTVQLPGGDEVKVQLTEEQFLGLVKRKDAEYAEVAFVLLPKHNLEINPRDREWQEALSTEFKIGGAIMTHDDQWIREKKTLPERWARVVRLAVTPRDVKLHDYQLPPPVRLGEE